MNSILRLVRVLTFRIRYFLFGVANVDFFDDILQVFRQNKTHLGGGLTFFLLI